CSPATVQQVLFRAGTDCAALLVARTFPIRANRRRLAFIYRVIMAVSRTIGEPSRGLGQPKNLASLLQPRFEYGRSRIDGHPSLSYRGIGPAGA
ncbi:MAG: hypothetical protein WBR18_02225, partial [Anaerolineales bacterium]